MDVLACYNIGTVVATDIERSYFDILSTFSLGFVAGHKGRTQIVQISGRRGQCGVGRNGSNHGSDP